jgi:hypothetical protein
VTGHHLLLGLPPIANLPVQQTLPLCIHSSAVNHHLCARRVYTQTRACDAMLPFETMHGTAWNSQSETKASVHRTHGMQPSP